MRHFSISHLCFQFLRHRDMLESWESFEYPRCNFLSLKLDSCIHHVHGYKWMRIVLCLYMYGEIQRHQQQNNHRCIAQKKNNSKNEKMRERERWMKKVQNEILINVLQFSMFIGETHIARWRDIERNLGMRSEKIYKFLLSLCTAPFSQNTAAHTISKYGLKTGKSIAHIWNFSFLFLFRPF